MSVLYVTQELFCIFHVLHISSCKQTRYILYTVGLLYSKKLLTSISVSISRQQEYICMNNVAQQNLSQIRKKKHKIRNLSREETNKNPLIRSSAVVFHSERAGAEEIQIFQ